jgi:hypothetical protein
MSAAAAGSDIDCSGINHKLLEAIVSPSSVLKMLAGGVVVGLVSSGITWSNNNPKPSGDKLICTFR